MLLFSGNMKDHVVIVGAGAAGLMAADVLIEKGFAVTVLEADNRIGGRIKTHVHPAFSQSIEAGAEFVHGDQPLTKSLLKKAGGDLVRLSGNMYRIQNGELEEGDFFGDQWGTLMKELNKLEVDQDMASFMDTHFHEPEYQELRKSVTGFVQGYDAADLTKVSAFALRDEWNETDEEQQFHIRGGYMTLMNFLQEKLTASGGKIELNSVVKRITWSSGKATISTEGGQQYDADKVILTIPLGALQSGAVDFNPPIPNYFEAISNIGFGGVIKFLFEFKEAFWETHAARPLKNVAFIFSDAEVPTWWTQSPDKTPILTGWLGGPPTFDPHLTDEVLYEKAINSLSDIFKCSQNDIKSRLRHWHIANWTKDPHTKGAYAYATVKTNNARKILSEPVSDTIYFAGEAFYEGAAMGTVEAALVSGRFVAEKIIGD
jgi:monoamine oxidase